MKNRIWLLIFFSYIFFFYKNHNLNLRIMFMKTEKSSLVKPTIYTHQVPDYPNQMIIYIQRNEILNGTSMILNVQSLQDIKCFRVPYAFAHINTKKKCLLFCSVISYTILMFCSHNPDDRKTGPQIPLIYNIHETK